MSGLNGLSHVALATGDMDATIRFWRDLLGCRLVGRLGRPGQRAYFFEWPRTLPVAEKEAGVPVAGPFALDHVALGVGSLDDLFALKDRCAAAGIAASDVTDHGFLYSVYLHDPNGITVECCCPARGVDLEAAPVAVEQDPTPVAREGTDPNPSVWPAPTSRGEWPVVPGTGYRAFAR
ncbi:MAG TPA: VOC family protein [Methanoregulaceae archaeon]|nr:VOC family protein [Methanoregulaceae archaeon]